MIRFKWLNVETKYREERPSIHGSELRWLLNVDTVLDTLTGRTIIRGVIRHPGIAVIVPFCGDDQIALMRQYRFSIDGELWEAPAGTVNGKEVDARMVATESPLECASRELKEETGFEAGRLEPLGECYAMPGSNDEVIYAFAAYDLTQREQSLDTDEMIGEIRTFSSAEILKMISGGEIRDAKTILALMLALSRLPRGVRIS